MISNENYTINRILNEITLIFTEAGIPDPRIDIEIILENVLGVKKIDLSLNGNRYLQKNELDIILEIVKKRTKRIPLYYILGYAPFMNWEFKVDSSVLIPRPETELVVERIESLIKNKNIQSPKILDIGTGSGCIAISLAKIIPDAKITAYDYSNEALKIAEENSLKIGVKDKINFVLFDIMKEFSSLPYAPFDIIVSNPPYIKQSELDFSQGEIQFEPRAALDGGKDGLDFYRRIAELVNKYLFPNGYLVLEIGYNQADEIKELLNTSAKSISVEIYKDYQGLDRIIVAKKRG